MATRKTDRGIPSQPNVTACDAIGATIGVSLSNRNYDAARSTLEEAIEQLQRQDDLPEFFAQPLADIGLDYRICEALEKHADVITVGDVFELGTERIMNIHGMGPLSMIEILQKLLGSALRYVPR